MRRQQRARLLIGLLGSRLLRRLFRLGLLRADRRMARWKSIAVGGTLAAQHFLEIGQLAVNFTRHGLPVRIRIGIGVLDHPARRGSLHDVPVAFLFFQLIGNLHGGVGWRSGLGTKTHVSARLIVVDGDAVEISVHCL